MYRRAFLGTVLALSVAGCSASREASGSLSMEALPDDSAIARRYAGATEDLSRERRVLVEAAIAGEAPRRTGRFPPYEAPRPLEHGGAFYEIVRETVDTQVVTRYTIRVDYDPETAPSTVIAYADLPDADKRALYGQIPPGDDVPTGEGFDLDSTYRYPIDADSVLLENEYDGISYDGTTYRIAIDPDREVTVSTYEYRAERIAPDAPTLGRQLRERHLFGLIGLSAAERDIVEQATRIYRPEGEAPDAFRSLAARIQSHDPIETEEERGTWLAEYDETVYWTILEYPSDTDEGTT